MDQSLLDSRLYQPTEDGGWYKNTKILANRPFTTKKGF